MASKDSHKKDLIPASTVVLVRSKEMDIEVYLMRRSSKSRFMPGKFVFPGGKLEDQDGDSALWRNFTCRRGINKGGLSEEQIFASWVAAVRETFEEAGVLIAIEGKEEPHLLEELLGLRKEGLLPRNWLRSYIDESNCHLSLSRLLPWSRWVTPQTMARRFDAHFFLYIMSEYQTCSPDRREMTEGVWLSPIEALSGNIEGRIPLSPPTVVTLQDLVRFNSLHEIREESSLRSLEKPYLPRMIRLREGLLILEPWDPMINTETLPDQFDLRKKVLPAGEAFSRLWYDKGAWLPVSM